jgi:hypothetical protein
MDRRRSARRCAVWGWLLLPACVAPACSPVGTGQDLVIDGSVTSSASGAGIAGATVNLRYEGPLTHESRWLQSTTTDASGGFTLRVDRLEGYAHPNCYVLGVSVEAAGHHPGSGALVPPSSSDPTCEGGRATASVQLQPAQGAGTADTAPR